MGIISIMANDCLTSIDKTPIDIDKELLLSLYDNGQIDLTTTAEAFIAQESHSLQRLRQKMTSVSQPLSAKDAYLNLYDRLFRHISIALLAQGYQLTARQPHQTLRHIVRQSAPDTQVQQVIAHRHTLKTTTSSLNCKKSIATLTKLLNDYDIRDAQACQTLCLLPLQRIVPSTVTN